MSFCGGVTLVNLLPAGATAGFGAGAGAQRQPAGAQPAPGRSGWGATGSGAHGAGRGGGTYWVKVHGIPSDDSTQLEEFIFLDGRQRRDGKQRWFNSGRIFLARKEKMAKMIQPGWMALVDGREDSTHMEDSW